MDNVEKVILDRWEASQDLNTIMPAASLHVGWDPEEKAKDDQLPAGMLNLQSTRGEHSSDGRSNEHSVRIQVWCLKHSEGCAIRDQICGFRHAEDGWRPGVFDNAAWEAEDVIVTLCRVENSHSMQEDDRVWQFIFDLVVTCDGR